MVGQQTLTLPVLVRFQPSQPRRRGLCVVRGDFFKVTGSLTPSLHLPANGHTAPLLLAYKCARDAPACYQPFAGLLYRNLWASFSSTKHKEKPPDRGGFCFGWAREKRRTETGMRGAVGSKTGGIKQWDAAQQKGRNRFTGPCRRQSPAITSHPSQPENLAFMRVYGLFYARIGHLQNQPKIAQNSPLMRN